jgi:hypothetical protein
MADADTLTMLTSVNKLRQALLARQEGRDQGQRVRRETFRVEAVTVSDIVARPGLSASAAPTPSSFAANFLPGYDPANVVRHSDQAGDSGRKRGAGCSDADEIPCPDD